MERLVVKARLQDEDVSWLDRLFPANQRFYLVVDEKFSQLHGGRGVDKGRVADLYLQWIIERYDNLPETMIFLPPEQQSKSHAGKHVLAQDAFELRSAVLKLHTLAIQSSGFSHLRCPSPATCSNLVQPFRNPPDELRTSDESMDRAWQGIFGNKDVALDLATVPSAAFAVSRAQVQKRPEADYRRARIWLNKSKMDDDSAGRVMEYLWPVIFGRDEVYCPKEKQCRCDLYGRCQTRLSIH